MNQFSDRDVSNSTCALFCIQTLTYYKSSLIQTLSYYMYEYVIFLVLILHLPLLLEF